MPDAEVFDKTKKKATEHGSGNTAYSADDASDNAFQDCIEPHGRFDVSFEGNENTGDAGESGPQLKHEAPKILLSTEPALLVPIDGKPVFQSIDGSRYERVVNTPYLLARGGIDLYLYVGSNTWYEARAVEGPWARAERVPEEVLALVDVAEDSEAPVEEAKIVVAQSIN